MPHTPNQIFLGVPTPGGGGEGTGRSSYYLQNAYKNSYCYLFSAGKLILFPKDSFLKIPSTTQMHWLIE